MLTCIRRFFSRKTTEEKHFIDPTGVLMKYDDRDCFVCAAPYMTCVNMDECPRATIKNLPRKKARKP